MNERLRKWAALTVFLVALLAADVALGQGPRAVLRGVPGERPHTAADDLR